jgi:ceramide glucosyltransferase
VLAWRLVAGKASAPVPESPSEPDRSLSIFKPLPPLGARGLGAMAAGIESFVAQLDAQSELLLGIHEADRAATENFVARLHATHPGVRLKVFFRSTPDDVPNPKIAWQKILAHEAEGDLWLWSDADIVAPAGFLRAARDEYRRNGVAMMTFPYVIRDVTVPPALLEALFVNVEFYPGVLLLRRLGPVDFGLGAAMLFSCDEFERRVNWDDLGPALADDFVLGQMLRPVRIGTASVETVAGAATWKEAFLHDMRWAKTIRWNRPGGTFARILVMPVVGWLAAAACHPSQLFVWAGLLGMIQADVVFAAAICRGAGCRLRGGNLIGLEIWSLWRIALWFWCWVPGRVFWSGKWWDGPRKYS